MRYVLPYGLAIAMTLVAVAGIPASSEAEGDTNGDQQINVLDVQTVVSHVLSGPPGAAPSDVNGDGRVDVLDLQRILAQAAHADRPNPKPPNHGRPDATVPVRPEVPAPLALALCVVSPLETEQAAACSRRCGHERPVAIAAQTERYLLNLTPHAPPLFSHGYRL